MQVSDILLMALDSTQVMRQHNIQKDFKQVKEKIAVAQQVQQTAKQKKQKQFLKIYVNVLQRINNELKTVKLKYKNLDKDKLKEQRCLKLAQDIKLFRQECYLLRQKLEKTKIKIKKQKARDSALFCEKKAMQTLSMRKKSRTKSLKFSYNGLKSMLDETHIGGTQKNFRRNRIYSNLNTQQVKRPFSTYQNEKNTSFLKSNKKFTQKFSQQYRHQFYKKKKNFRQRNNTSSFV